MTNKDDGGPAFPETAIFRTYDAKSNLHGEKIFNEGGLTKRDWFAGMALQGLLCREPSGFGSEYITGWSYRIADAMIAERGK